MAISLAMGLTLFRVFSGFFAFGLARYLSLSNLISVVVALSISHNSLAFVYSESQRAYLRENWRRHLLPLLGLAAAVALTCWLDRPPVYYLFAIHHICNETYFAQARFRQSDRALVLARALLHTVAFGILTRAELEFFGWHVPMAAWALALAGASLVYFGWLAMLKGTEVWRDASYELVAVGFAVWSGLNYSLILDHVLVYHFLFWGMYPMARLRRQGRLLVYLGWTFGLFGLGLLFTPIGPHWGGLDDAGLSYVSRLTAFFHFFSSAALSRSHPAWVQRWFFARHPLRQTTETARVSSAESGREVAFDRSAAEASETLPAAEAPSRRTA
jgi:hypothetical protein